ncbi:MAG: hypothetical protein KAR32_13275 [Candidatus Omnitrophica bacterium]|nr:hypothetical protein [Candidatus Omnitrophota bacterium]
MTEENKKKKCNCCLGFGLVVFISGVLSGFLGGGGFGLPHILAVVVGVALILCGKNGTKFCKCHK